MSRNLVAENWRLERSRYLLVGNKCTECEKYYFPNVQICTDCNISKLDEYVFSGKGKLIEWTKIYEVAKGFELFAPLYYGIIELEEGVRVAAQITEVTDDTKLIPGIKTQMVFRKLFEDGSQGVLTYGFKAEPQI
ncbi:MAG: Zn-ribbon domain-containing OB-fold protein [Candidatus Heimdallarchaeota archaeon]|nr:Zn-ribbon domain-containing OB-fold protein [Candidatus Heimdallarchaeota archaeon]MDH5644430.1 Zn-ribbon domain-containing OB-fold protein [Candidatus Heimdallarchaeota archaeon]